MSTILNLIEIIINLHSIIISPDYILREICSYKKYDNLNDIILADIILLFGSTAK